MHKTSTVSQLLSHALHAPIVQCQQCNTLNAISPDIKLGEQECGLLSVERQWKWKSHLKELAALDVIAQDHVGEAPHFPLPLGHLLPLHLQLLLVMPPALLHLLKLQVLRFQLALHANIPPIKNWHQS